MIDFFFHLSLSHIHSAYVLNPVSSINWSHKTFWVFQSMFLSIIIVARVLFPIIKCPIHLFNPSLNLFHIDFWVFILWRTSFLSQYDFQTHCPALNFKGFDFGFLGLRAVIVSVSYNAWWVFMNCSLCSSARLW